MSESDTYEIFAVRYGRHNGRTRRENFIVTDDHDRDMPLDYFVWAITNQDRTIIVDTGFDPKEAALRGREVTRLPREGLAMLGIDSAKVEDVVVTHLHYDHAGTCGDFPNARFHLQDHEMAYATGRYMQNPFFGKPYTVHHVTDMVQRVYEGRVAFHDGDDELAPGMSVHHIGGHTMGIQCVRVRTARGWVVLASDATHFYENFEAGSPFPIVFNVRQMIDGFDKMRGLAESMQHIIPGHDPLVMERYPTPKPDLEGVVVRLDVAPKG